MTDAVNTGETVGFGQRLLKAALNLATFRWLRKLLNRS
jgi:hypothetical protein